MTNSVAEVMMSYYGPEISETAKLFKLVDQFFDCLKTRALKK